MYSRLDDSDLRKWVYHTQTEKKHKILKSYLDAWYPILGNGYDRLVVVDGFAGRASYIPRADKSPDGEIKGSPLIMLKSLFEHKSFTNGRLRKLNEFIFLFIEADEQNHAALKNALDTFKAENQPWPLNVKTHVSRCKFEDVHTNGIAKYILELQPSTQSQATFLFVDPFGFTGYSLELLRELCQSRPRHVTELFLNFMSSFMLSFAMSDLQISNMSRLYGMDKDEWIRYRDEVFRVNPTEEKLVDLFQDRLQKGVGFNNVLSLQMRRRDETPIYFLIYATRHWKGVSCMKNSMWRHDPEAFERLCSNSDALDLILMNHFRTKQPDVHLNVEEIRKYVVSETPFRISQTTGALKKLEKNGCIKVYLDSDRNRIRETYPDDSVIIFESGQPTTIETSMTQRRPPNRRQSTRTARNQMPSLAPSKSLITNYFSSSKAAHNENREGKLSDRSDSI